MRIREISRYFPIERLNGECVHRHTNRLAMDEHLRRRGDAKVNEVLSDGRKAKESIRFGAKRMKYRR